MVRASNRPIWSGSKFTYIFASTNTPEISSRFSARVHQNVVRGTENEAYKIVLPLMRHSEGRGF